MLADRRIAWLLITAFCFSLGAVTATTARKPTVSWSVEWQPQDVVNGSPILFQVKAPVGIQSLDGTWLGHTISFARNEKTRIWYGLAGVNLDTKPGTYTLILDGTTAAGKLSHRATVTIRAGKYREVKMTVAKKFTEPDPEEMQKIEADKATKQQFFSRVTPERAWSGGFSAPVNAAVSDVFGTRRTFNGKVQSFHQGLDYGVPAGTPVAAVNRGTVLLARPLYFEGNCVVLDHGQGLLTLYLHLSKIEVKEGEAVARGQQIGLSGGTGRATGPHLHMAVRWQGVYLNPGTLLDLKIPAIP